MIRWQRWVVVGFAVLGGCGPTRPSDHDRLAAAVRALAEAMDSEIRVDPTVQATNRGLEDSLPDDAAAVTKALTALGIERGDARFAQMCAEYAASLGVPGEVAAPMPKGCPELEVPVFALGFERSGDLLSVSGTGWSWARAIRFSATVSPEGMVEVRDLASYENLY